MKLCPTCHRDLDEIERLGVAVDLCPKCRGIWLEEGELERVVAYLQARHTPAEPSDLSPHSIRVYETSVRQRTDEANAPSRVTRIQRFDIFRSR